MKKRKEKKKNCEGCTNLKHLMLMINEVWPYVT